MKFECSTKQLTGPLWSKVKEGKKGVTNFSLCTLLLYTQSDRCQHQCNRNLIFLTNRSDTCHKQGDF